MVASKEKMSVVRKMMIAMVLGIICGVVFLLLKNYLMSSGGEKIWGVINSLLFQDITAEGGEGAVGLFFIIQKLFMNGLQMTIVPLVLISITLSMCSMSDMRKLGRIAAKTIGGFLGFYVAGCVLASAVAWIAKNAGAFSHGINIQEAATAVTEVQATNILTTVINAVPENITSILSVNNRVVAVVFVAVVLGICFNILEGQLKVVKNLFEDADKIIQIVVNFVIDKMGPVAIFCMLTRSFAIYGVDQLRSLINYMLITCCALLIFLFIIYPLAVMLLAKQNPVIFIKKILKVGFFAFSTVSSAATLPLNRQTCTEELGCSETISDFVLPLGMTVNMNGTAIMHIIACTFIATSAGMPVVPANFLTMAVLAIASSAGTPAIPVAGSIMAYAVLTGTGFTSEACVLIYSLVLAMNKPVEMVLTSLNVVGDAAVNVIVSHSENELNTEIYNS